jgi:hypothetical protein
VLLLDQAVTKSEVEVTFQEMLRQQALAVGGRVIFMRPCLCCVENP